MNHSLRVNNGTVKVFTNPGPAAPSCFAEQEACRRLLAFDGLLDACEAVLKHDELCYEPFLADSLREKLERAVREGGRR